MMDDDDLGAAMGCFNNSVVEDSLVMKARSLKKLRKTKELDRKEVSVVVCLAEKFHMILKDYELRITNLKISLFYKNFDQYLEYNC